MKVRNFFIKSCFHNPVVKQGAIIENVSVSVLQRKADSDSRKTARYKYMNDMNDIDIGHLTTLFVLEVKVKFKIAPISKLETYFLCAADFSLKGKPMHVSKLGFDP